MAAKLAITGANGFVGRHLIQAASSAGWDVTAVVRSKQAARAVILAGAHPVIVPGLEASALGRAFQEAAAVVHLAQIGAERDGLRYADVNVGGTLAAIAAAQAAGVPRLVYLSGLGVARYGMARRCTNGYFLSKLAAEVALHGSGRGVAVLRPSYIVGHGSELVPGLLEGIASGEVELVGRGDYRMQPVAIHDATAAILAAAALSRSPAVFDLVGPEPISYRGLVERVSRLAGLAGRFRTREIPEAEADRRAAADGYRGMLADELDCLLCDETADHRPLEALLGRFLTPLDDMLATAVRREKAPTRGAPG